jgi:hypothetical protein
VKSAPSPERSMLIGSFGTNDAETLFSSSSRRWKVKHPMFHLAIYKFIYIYYVANKYLAILDQTNNSQRYRKDDESPSISSIKDHKSPIKSIHVA